RDLFVQDLVNGEIAPHIASKIVQRHVAVLQLLIELLFGIRSLKLVQLAVNFIVGSEQTKLFCTLHHDLLIDQLFQDIQPKALRLFADWLLPGIGRLVLVVLLHLRPADGPPVYFCHHVRAMLRVTAARENRAQNQDWKIKLDGKFQRSSSTLWRFHGTNEGNCTERFWN